MFPPILAETKALRPTRILQRLRPVRLEVVARKLGDFGLRARVLGLTQRHFADKMGPEWTALDFWFENYCEFLRYVEHAGWFEINWDMLQMYEANWLENGEDDCMGHDILVDYVDGIPVKCYGWGAVYPETEWDEESELHGYPALELLRALTFGPEEGRFRSETVDEILERVSERSSLNETDNEQIRRNLERACQRMKPPWKWLGEMADFAADRSGNVILDTTVDLHEPWPCQWTWEKDLDTLRAAWKEAKPVVEHFKDFVQHCSSDDDLELIAWMAAGKSKRRR